jgi:DNA-binding XRE family transcriptional regulator/thiol-disulfide isomerase/thioredoxin
LVVCAPVAHLPSPAQWCGHCKSLAPKYEALAQGLAGVSTLVIAKLDATANDWTPKDVYEVKGFPTIYFKPAGKPPVAYEGEREAPAMAAWLAAHATHTFDVPAALGAAPPAAAKKAKKAKKAAKKTAPKKTAPKKRAEKPKKPTKKVAAAGETKAGTKVKRPASLGKTGPKGNKNPTRNAADGGKFGLQVARGRKAKGWTQRELAEKVGCNQPSIANIEKGTCGASEALSIAIAKKLGINPPPARKKAKVAA